MAEQFKVHCRIIDYLDTVNPKLAAIIRGVCAEGSLGSLKGKPGITFLMPTDKDFLKKLHDLAYSDNVDDVDMANELINNLIVRNIYKNAGDWLAHRDDIANSLFPSQSLELDTVTGETVVFKSGAKATPDKSFKDGSPRKNLAVWKLTGEIPVTTDRISPAKYIKLMRKKTGGYYPSSAESQTLRFRIMQQVESEYLAACKGHAASWWGSGAGPSSVYNRYVASLADWMNLNGYSDLVRNLIVPQLSFDIIDFYAIVEPHRASGNYLLSDDIIRGWFGAKHAGVISKEQIQQLLASKDSAAKVFADRKCIIACSKRLQAEFDACVNSNKMRQCAEQVGKYYDILDAENRIGDAAGVFPQQLADFYRENPGLKQTTDELRYVSIAMTHKVEQSCDCGMFNELSNLIGECLHASNKTERMANLKLLNGPALRFHVAPRDRVRDIEAFVKSAMFMYIPLTEAEIREESAKKRPSVDGIALPDVRGNIYAKYTFDQDASAGFTGGCELTVASIERMNLDELSDDVKEALRAKMGL